MKRNNSDGGFTLVELLIVIVVIAILAAIIVVSYNGVTTQARLSTLKSALDSANTAVGADLASSNLTQPTGFPSSLPASSGIVLELTVPNSSTQAATVSTATAPISMPYGRIMPTAASLKRYARTPTQSLRSEVACRHCHLE